MSKAIVPAQSDEDDFGPAMLACLPKERAFILALLEREVGRTSSTTG